MKGNVRIENVQVTNTGIVTVFSVGWHNHDFGYPTYLPQNAVIDNLTLEKKADVILFLQLFADLGDIGYDTYLVAENLNKMTPTKSIVILNNSDNCNFTIPNTSYFKDMTVSTEDLP